MLQSRAFTWYKYFVICESIWVFLNATGLFLYLYRSVTHYDVTCTGEVKKYILRDIAKIVGYRSFDRAAMPPKSKKKRHSLEAAAKGREILKQARVDPDATVSPAMEGVISENEAHAADSAVLHEEPGPSRPPVDTTEGDVSPLKVMEAFVEGWVQALDHEDRKSLAMLLCFVLVKELSLTETNAAALTAREICKNEKTVHCWHTDLVSNGGAFSESNQGRYQRTGVLWANEDLNKKATAYVRANAAVKGKPNMTSMEFCKWVNKTLLPNSTLEPGAWIPTTSLSGDFSEVAP